MTEYSERPNVKAYPLCKCGHPAYDHAVKFTIRGYKDGRCSICFCPNYEYSGKATVHRFLGKKMTSNKIEDWKE